MAVTVAVAVVMLLVRAGFGFGLTLTLTVTLTRTLTHRFTSVDHSRRPTAARVARPLPDSHAANRSTRSSGSNI